MPLLSRRAFGVQLSYWYFTSLSSVSNNSIARRRNMPAVDIQSSSQARLRPTQLRVLRKEHPSAFGQVLSQCSTHPLENDKRYLSSLGFSIQRSGLNVFGSGNISGLLCTWKVVIPVLVPGGIAQPLYCNILLGAIRWRRCPAPYTSLNPSCITAVLHCISHFLMHQIIGTYQVRQCLQLSCQNVSG